MVDAARRLSRAPRRARVGAAAVTAVALAHLVPLADVGALAVALALRELAIAAASAAIVAPLVQRRAVRREQLEAGALLALSAGIGLALVAALVVPLAAEPLPGERVGELIRLFAPAFVLAGAAAVPAAQLRRERQAGRVGGRSDAVPAAQPRREREAGRMGAARPRREADLDPLDAAEVAGALATAALAIGLAIGGLDGEAYVLGLLGGMAASAGILLASAPLVLPRWHGREVRDLADLALAPDVAGIAVRNVDWTILGVRLASPQVGSYDLSAPDPDPVRGNVTLAWPLLAYLIVVAPVLVPWLFGEGFDPVVLPAQILAAGGMAAVLTRALAPPRELHALAALGLYAVAALVAFPQGLTAVAIAVTGVHVLALAAAYALAPPERPLAEIAPAGISGLVLLAATLPPAWILAGPLPVLPYLTVTGAVAVTAYTWALRWAFPGAWIDVAGLGEQVLGEPRRVAHVAVRRAIAAAGPQATRGLRRLRQLIDPARG